MEPHKSPGTNKLHRQLTGAVIAGVVVGLGIGMLQRAGGRSALVLVGGLAAVAAWWFVGVGKAGTRDWLAPPAIFWMAVVLCYVVRPASLVLGMSPVGQRAIQHLEEAMGLVLLTTVGVVWGYGLRGAKIIARWLPRAANDWEQPRVAAAVGGLWVLGAACWVGLIQGSGGVEARLAGYAQGLATGKGILVVLSAAALALSLVLAWLQYLQRKLSHLAMIALAAATVPMLAMHGQRSALIVPLLMAVAIYHYLCQRLTLRQLIAIVTLVVIIFVGLGLPRLQLTPELVVRAYPAAYAKLAAGFFVRNLTSFDALMLSLEGIPEQLDYQWGRGYWDALMMIVPRAVYPDKPQRNLFNRALRPGRTTSMALPPPGEGYLNFGWGGALLGGVLLGLIYRGAYIYRQRHPDNEGVLLAYAFFFAFFIIIFRGGLMGGHLGLLAVYLVLIGAVGIFCGRGRLVVRRERPKIVPA